MYFLFAASVLLLITIWVIKMLMTVLPHSASKLASGNQAGYWRPYVFDNVFEAFPRLIFDFPLLPWHNLAPL